MIVNFIFWWSEIPVSKTFVFTKYLRLNLVFMRNSALREKFKRKKENFFRWLLGFRKVRSSKEVEILHVVLVLRVPSWKSAVFSLMFTMKLSSAVLSNLDAHSTLNFARTFLYFETLTQIKHQRSKIWIL